MNDGIPNNRRVLIIDDNPDIHRDFDKILTPAARTDALDALEALVLGNANGTGAAATDDDTFEIDHAHQGEEGFAKIRAAHAEGRPYLAAFVDMRMPPGWDGLRTIRAIREIDADISLVICTAYSDHSWDKISAEVKALDKLLVLKKPFDPIEAKSICRALRERYHLLQRARLRTTELESLVSTRTRELEAEREKDKVRLGELEQIVEQRTADLRRMAMHDELTGLPNRVLFYERLLRAIDRTRQWPGHNYAVLYLDFDRFKVINDSLGHVAGDQLLMSISRRISAVLDLIGVSQEDVRPLAARLGGDEFCVLLEGYESDRHVYEVANSLLDALATPYTLVGREMKSTASVGVTLSTFGYGNAEDVLRDADTAMYCAKLEGRGRFVVFNRSMHDAAMRRLILESDLHFAVERNELQLLFQPIVSLKTGEVTGAESLLRWQHPKQGMVSPADFIPLAEETNDIIDIGAWVIGEASRQMASWLTGPTRVDVPYLSVNVSRRQLSDPDLMAKFDDAIRQSKIDPSRLAIELTETTLFQDADSGGSNAQTIPRTWRPRVGRRLRHRPLVTFDAPPVRS
ncbi:MAG: diguanylate cyclase [Tepidisphaeraceae bacterium]